MVNFIHVSFGITSFILCLITVVFGAKTAGKFGKSRISKTSFKTHKFLSITTGILVTISFLLGLFTSGGFEPEIELELEGPHFWTGLTAFILILLQILPSLIIKKRKKIRLIHRYIGYMLFIILLIQLVSGILRID